MAGKHDTVESARRPLALHKLSGLINRGASKTKRAVSEQQPQVVVAAAAPAPAPAAVAAVPAVGAAPNGDKAASIFRLKARKKDPSPDAGPRFRPLEVDLNTLSSYRLSDGWLDDKPKPKPDPGRESDKENQSPRRSRDRATSSTPIADLYAGQSVKASSPTSTQSIKGPSQHRGAARPFSFIRPSSPTYGRKSLESPRHLPSRGGSILDRPRPVEPSESVLERGRPVEPSRITGTEPEDLYRTRSHSRPTNSWRDYMPKPVPQASTATIRMVPSSTGPDDDYDPFRSDDSGSATYDPFRADSVSPASKPGHLRGRESLDATNRHSMYAVVPSSTSRPGTANRAAPPSRCASDQPLDRIRTWQKSVTSAPSTAGAPAAGGLPARSLSKRGVGNRLAWIRELEDKKASGGGAAAGPAPGGFKKPSGSVADRLRMFEVKKSEAAAVSAAPVVTRGLPPLSRTNSTASRLSSVGFDAASSSAACDNATATPRTSIDSVRTSNRASSVMSYYDPSFREKMEGVVSSYADKDDETKKQKVKAAFVNVMSPKKEEAAPPEAAAAEAGKAEEKKAEDKPEEKAESKPEEAPEKVEMPAVEKQEEKSEPAAAPSEEEAKSDEKAEDKPETVEPVAEDKVQPATPAQESEATSEPAAEAAKAAELPQPVVEEAPAAAEAPAAEPEEKASSAPQAVEEPAVVATPATTTTTTATEEPAKEEAPVVAPAPVPEVSKAAPAADEAYQPEAEGVAEEVKFFKPEKCTLINE